MPAKRGRPAKPTALKKVHNAGKRKLNDAEPEGPELGAEKKQPAGDSGNIVSLDAKRDAAVADKIEKDKRGHVVAVAAPSHVTGIALDKWNELAPSLATARVLTEWDLDALARYCNAFKTEVQAQSAIEELQKKIIALGGHPAQAFLDKTPNDMKIMSAYLTVRNAAARDAHKFGAALGLDPVSRSSIKVDRPDDNEGWREFG